MNAEQPNPFAPPKVETDLGGAYANQVASHYVLATRGERLLAALVDNALFLLPLFFVIFGVGLTNEAMGSADPEVAAGLLGILFMIQFPVQWYLIARRGQTIGKIILKIRIEHLDGRPVTFFTGVILRNWILGIANMIIGFVFLIDVLMIFGHEQRCLHDLIANTRVVALTDDARPWTP